MRDSNLLSQHVPLALTREGRVLLLHEVAEALVSDRPVRREAALFVGSVLRAWLDDGRSPFEAHARVGAPRGSHRTVGAILAELLIADERQRDGAPLESGRVTNPGNDPT